MTTRPELFDGWNVEENSLKNLITGDESQTDGYDPIQKGSQRSGLERRNFGQIKSTRVAQS